YEEYCLLKTMSLIQFDNHLSEEGQRAICALREDLLAALIAHIDRRFRQMTSAERTRRSLKLTGLFP
ncbi:hypothetical protein PMAYCL1PPCAC_16713, partial [Pristionchus mayeri]